MTDDAKRIETEAIAALTGEQRNHACGILLRCITPKVWGEVQKAIAKNPKKWWVGYHFGWGMGIRNLLRKEGFKDSESKSGNLDDIYIPLVEEAVRRLKEA